MIDDRAVANREIASMTFKLKGGPRRKRAALTLGGRLVQCGPFACIAGQIEPARQNGYALKHTTPEHKANEIGLKAVNQNEYALKHEAPRHEATQAGLRGGGTETECSQDFSTRCFIPPVRTASPNLPGDALGVPGGGAVLGLGKNEAIKPLHLREIGKHGYFAPPASPGLFKRSPPFNTKPPGTP